MKEQGKNSSTSEVNLLDFSISRSDESPDQIQSNSYPILHDRHQAINVTEENLRAKGSSSSTKCDILGALVMTMSKEELKIREELEIEIEKDLEEEIKNEMYNLALRLHRLYRHRRERIARVEKVFNNGFRSSGSKSTNATFSEMNITIKMEEGSKIEIKEIKKRNHREKVIRPKTSISDHDNKKAKMYRYNTTEFDWVRTLRSIGHK
ncbi:hypothetical protein BVC80_9075g58 [Macleaya cordata]|uniref:Uncharacterized protein n=1 Tax=Macleaya cordata TaxID=56857 RepID=A0A200PUE4_MACCD|nr:hypothetical protein BVC80_9075g58 [Macleaya cordata]